jgi:Fur family ferric uptake transcriptional regulator
MAGRPPSHRTLVAKIVHSSRTHPTADDVFMEARKVEPSISLATVYRQLRALVRDGQLQERNFNGTARFDANLRPHAHLVCTRCGTISDFDPNLSDVLESISREAKGWTTAEVDVEARGLCPGCRGE